MALVDLAHVSRSYGNVRALDDISLTLEPGTIGLVGNNGAGKSTLLKVLLGLLRPDSGSGSILGVDLAETGSKLRGRVGYMPEAAATVALLRGVEFVALSGDLYGMPHRDAQRRAHEVLNYVGLGELRYRRLDEYSSGNLQRLKLAAALVHDPQLLLLDEPTNGLDPGARVTMLQLLRDLIAQTGKSIILCTHLLSDVEQLCEQIVVLDRGRVVRSGTIESLRTHNGAEQRYEVGWHGDAAAWKAALENAGIAVATAATSQRLIVTLRQDTSTSQLFEVARSAGVVLTHLKREEEDLEGLFFRVTEQDPRPHVMPAVSSSGDGRGD